jgi:hypothetical protein
MHTLTLWTCSGECTHNGAMALLCGGAPGACGASHAVELAARGPYSGASPTRGKLDLQVVPRCSPERSQ